MSKEQNIRKLENYTAIKNKCVCEREAFLVSLNWYALFSSRFDASGCFIMIKKNVCKWEPMPCKNL